MASAEILAPVRLASWTIGSGLFGVGLLACFVEVDETLIERAAVDAAARDGGGASDAVVGVADGADGAEPYPGLTCGKTFCTPPGEVCCATTFGDPDIANGACSTKDLCKSGDFFGCTSERDCAGAGLGDVLCCAVHVKGAFNLTKCASSCDATSSTLCDPKGSVCALGKRCLPSTEFPKLFECTAL